MAPEVAVPDVIVPNEELPGYRPWMSPRFRRVAEAVGFSAVLLALPGCAAAPTDKQIGAANRVEDHLPTSSYATTLPTTTAAATSPTEAPASMVAPSPTAIPSTTPAPQPSPEMSSDPPQSATDPTMADPPQNNNDDNGSAIGVAPNLDGAQPGICGIGGEPGDPMLEGLTAPNCDASAPVLVVGDVFPLCQVIGDDIVLGDSEVHDIWIKWQNQNGNFYFSPQVYLRGASTTLNSCD